MVELMVASTLIMIGLIGIFVLIIQSTGMNKDVVHRFEATHLSAEGIEIMKHIIDTDVAIKDLFFNSTLNASKNYEVQYDTSSMSMRDYKLTDIGYVSSTKPLSLDQSTGLYGYSGGIPTLYKRTIVVTSGTEEIQILSEVEWTNDGERKAVQLVETFKNWREGPDG